MDPLEFEVLTELLAKLGKEVEVSREEADFYLPDISDTEDMRSFYLPKVPKHFYYNPNVFRRLLGIR